MVRWSPANWRTATVWFGPIAAAGVMFVALLAQKGTTWSKLMPAARLPISGRDSGIILITGTDRAEGIVEAALDAPARVLWLVPAEAVTPQFPLRGDNSSAFVAVGPDGSMWRLVRDGTGNVQRREEPVRRRLARRTDSVVSSDAAAEETLRRRLPALAQYPTGMTFAQLDDPDRSDRADDLDPLLMVRVAGMAGMFLSAMVLFWNLSTAPSALRWATALLGFAAAASLLMGAFVVIAPWGPWAMPALPFALWVILGTACRFTEPGDAPRRAAEENPRRRRAEWVTFAAAAVATAIGIWHVAQGFAQRHLTVGDSARYLTGAHRAYERGHWPMRELADAEGGAGLTAMYPPGPAVFMTYCYWEVGVEPAKMFHPGRQTGSVWLLYSWFLAGLTITVCVAAVLAVSHLFPGRRGLAAVLAVAGVMYCLPTARAYVHAGETVIWPLMVGALIGAMAARSGRCRIAASAAVLCAGGMLLTKPEATVILAVLAVPFAIALAGLGRVRWRWSWVTAPALAALIALVPYLEWRRQKFVEGVPSNAGLIRPFGPADVWAERADYGRVLKRTWRMLVGPIGADDDPTFYPAVHHGAAFALAASALIAALQLQRHRLATWAVPAGCLVYFFGMSATYVFTDFPAGRQVQIEVSWNRLMVPMVMTVGAFAAVAGSELSRVRRVIARREHAS